MPNRLQPLFVPWMVSPSGADIRIEIHEGGDTRMSVLVSPMPKAGEDEGINPRISITFQYGQWVRTSPITSEAEPLPGVFDETEIMRIHSKFPDREDYWKAWITTGLCPTPRIYKVEESSWLQESGAHRFGCQHYVIEGDEMWVELLAQGFSWEWMPRADQSSNDV